MKKEDIVKLVVALAFIGWLFWSVGTTDILGNIARIGIVNFVIFFIATVAVILVNGLALFALYRTNSNISFGQFWKPFIASWVLGYVLPAKIGSLSLAVLLKDKVSPGESGAIFVADKVITLVLAIAIGAVLLPGILSIAEYWGILMFGIALILWGIAALYLKPLQEIVKKILGERAKFFYGYAKSAGSFAKKPTGIFLNAILTLVRFAVQAAILMAIYSVFGIHAGFLDMVVIVCSAALISLMPFTFSGLGVKENVFVFLATRMGLPPAESAAVAIASTVLSWASTYILPFIAWKDVKEMIEKNKI